MKSLPTHTFDFEFLTPCFSGTAEGKNAESSVLRVPPIRGHIRMWHVSLFGAADANAVWGSTAGDGCGSKVGVALKSWISESKADAAILPHKKSAFRVALKVGSPATLVITRLPGCSSNQWEHAEKATKLWLLLGTLGLRSARAAGSVWPSGSWVPQDAAALKTTLNTLGYKQPVQQVDAAILKDKSLAYEKNDALKLRHAASDTVGGSPRLFGGINPTRQPSPLKMKVALFATGPVLLLTGLSTSDMASAHGALKGHPLGCVSWNPIQ